jgi:nitroreductase
MKLSMDSIRDRVSVRSYDGEALGAEDSRALTAAFAEAGPCPLGHAPRFALVSDVEAGLGGVTKVGTYGLIKGVRAFVVGVVAKDELACVDFGYALEGIVLRATELGLGTCWIGGVFERGKILKALGAAKGEFAPAMATVGKAADSRSVQDQLAGRGSGQGLRKPPAELFFAAGGDGSWEPLADQGRWAGILEAVRIGPSASNKQPWRLIVDRRGGGERLHLAMDENRLYNNMLGATKLQELDMGIAMRHVEVTAAADGLRGSWKRLAEAPIAEGGARRYIASWVEG